MSPSSIVMSVSRLCPPLSRRVLRALIQRAGVREHWLTQQLMISLIPAQPRQEVRVGRGKRLIADLRGAHGRELWYCGSSDPAVARVLESCLSPGAVFFDCGANIGEFTIRASSLVQETGRVFAFEASPATYERLKENVVLNNSGNVSIHQLAIAGAPGRETLYLGGGVDSGSTSLQRPHDYRGEHCLVECVSLDSFIQAAKLERVDLVKMDVEGGEFAALRDGGDTLLAQFRPTLILEYNPVVANRAGWNLTDLLGLLKKYDYCVEPLEIGQALENLSPDGARQLEKCDLVAKPQR